MPFYCWDITVTADKKEANPLTKYLKLTKGIITKVDVKFPAGCRGMVKLRLFRYEQQLIPLIEDEWVTGDNELIPTETYAELTDVPYQLKLVACSPNTSYAHVITIRIQVTPFYVSTIPQLSEIADTLKQIADELGIEEGKAIE
jgi:hypothetical protein